jgi:2-hydroxy-6-oxonona-2,4-dienedioate hydrolase
MIHGTGGGFDQGLLFTQELLAKGYRIIAPSRFGYLRSSFPSDPSSANQADAFVELLDHLHIDTIAVAGGSAGALSAIEFAVRHPDRCAALLPIVPASYTPDSEAVTADHPPEGLPAAMSPLRSDFLFWLGTVVASDLMIGTLLATDPALLKTVEAAEAERAREILRSILPVSRRADGLINDAQLAGHPAPSALETITTPTFAISVEDDRFGTAKAARHIAASVPDARLTVFSSGGHIWLGHDRELFDQIDAFLTEIGYA